MKESSMMAEEKTVTEAFERAKRMMKDAGHQVGNNVRVIVDPNLGFMGYTFPKAGKFTIVVSGVAVDSGMLEGLLVHEMSHIYRMQTRHPSHNESIINHVVGSFGRRGLDEDYQQKILHDAVNHLEDLYADEISFKAFQGTRLFPPDVGSEFFQSWMTPDPVVSENPGKDRWVNASLMLRNSFAMSNMARHGIPDLGDKAKRANDRFLSRLPPNMAREFPYFYGVMTGLKEDVTGEEFTSLLSDYLGKLVGLAESVS